MEVLAVGICVVDLIARVPVFPEPDGRMMMSDFSQVVGGNATIAAVALARLGARVGFASVVGDDTFGQEIRRALVEDGVDLALLSTHPTAQTPTTVIISAQQTGTRSIINHPSVAQELLVPSEALLRAAEQATCVHLDHAALPAVADALLPCCRAAGVLTSFDAGVAVPGIERYLPLLDVFITTEAQLAALTGERDRRRALLQLRQAGPRVVGVTLGERGSAGLDEEGALVECPAFPVEVADSTGAGDVFHGAFLYAHLRGHSMHDALTFANATAALSCRAVGGRTGCPTLAEAQALMEQRTAQGAL